MQTEIHILSMTNEESRINTPVTNQQRRDLIEKYSVGGFNITDAALLTNIEYETARKIIGIYKKEQRSEKKKTGKAVNTKITPEIENFIELKIQENSQITLEQLKEKISRTYQLTVSIESIRKAIHRLKVTLKVASQTLEIVNSVQAKENRKI